MKRIIIGLLSGILFLTACGGTPPVTQTASIPVVERATSTPSPLPTATQTSIPSATPTASITPLATITPTAHPFSISTNNIQSIRQVAKIKGFEGSQDIRGVSEIVTFQISDDIAEGFLIAIGYASGDIRLFDSSTLSLVHQFKGEFAIDGITINHNKNLIVATNGSTAQIWDVFTEKLIKELDFGDTAYAIAFSEDGSRLVAQGYGKIRIWDTETWELIDRGTGWFLSSYRLLKTSLFWFIKMMAL